MASDKNPPKAPPPSREDEAESPGGEPPAWADGLKQLYDSVVDEPLPDSFLELLEQFDDDPEEEGDHGQNTGDSDEQETGSKDSRD